jgi:hypothetical protein
LKKQDVPYQRTTNSKASSLSDAGNHESISNFADDTNISDRRLDLELPDCSRSDSPDSTKTLIDALDDTFDKYGPSDAASGPEWEDIDGASDDENASNLSIDFDDPLPTHLRTGLANRNNIDVSSDLDSDLDSDYGFGERLLEDDPLYRARDSFINENLGEDDEKDPPPALSEHPAILNAYVHAWANAAYKGATHEATRSFLISAKSTIKTMLGNNDPPDNLDLSRMATTLRTLEKRLGVDPDELITYFVLCHSCFKCYHPSEINNLETATCTRPGCSDLIFDTKLNSSGVAKRIPRKTMPAASLKKALARMLKRPGKWEEMQHWRTDCDHEPAPPISRTEWLENLDPSAPINDIYDAWRWRSYLTGYERKWDPRSSTVEDVDIKRLDQRFVSLPCGLVAHINLDWFVYFIYQDILINVVSGSSHYPDDHIQLVYFG